MTVLEIEEKPGVWFEMEGGGRVQLRTLNADGWKAIRKQTVNKKVEFKRVGGKAERFEFEEVNDDLQNELFWDHIIMTWENFIDGQGKEIPCTKENKLLLMTRSAKFSKFVADSLKMLSDSEAATAEQTEKN
jgi:hypothetical protein